MWEKWGIRSSNACLQVWIGDSEELGIRVAGLSRTAFKGELRRFEKGDMN